MKPSNELFDLIQSLSKSEKRFFKLSSALQAGDKNYLRIFEFVDKQTKYDEEEVKNHFKKETFIKHYPSEKNHLYKLILKSLRSYYAEDSISSILKQEIKNIDILYKKALFKECNKFLYRAKELAIEHEKFYYLFELLNWEKILLEEAYEEGEFTKDLDLLIKEEQDTIDKLNNLAAYHVLYSKINYVFRSGGYVRNEEDKSIVDEISQHPLIMGKNTALSKRAATICYYIQGVCSTAKRDHQVALIKFLRVKEILDTNKHIRSDLQSRYVRACGSIILTLIDLNKTNEAVKLIEDLRLIVNEEGFASYDIEVMVFKATYLAQFRLHQQTGNFSKAIDLVEGVMEGLDKYKNKINKEQELNFLYNISLVFFAIGEYNKSLFWLNKILNDNEQHLRQDIYSYARLFNLVVHFELGNVDLLDYIIKSANRYLSKKNRSFELENLIMNNMRKLSKSPTTKVTKELFLSFGQELNQSLESKEAQVLLEYFDFSTWVKSKIGDLSFAQLIKEKNKVQG